MEQNQNTSSANKSTCAKQMKKSSKKSKAQQPSIPTSDLFKGISFCFPKLDAILSSKLVAILKEKIFANGGLIFEVGIDWLTPFHYYLVSEKVSLDKLKKTLKQAEDTLIHYAYVKDCIHFGSILPLENYQVGVPKPPAETVLETQQKLEKDSNIIFGMEADPKDAPLLAIERKLQMMQNSELPKKEFNFNLFMTLQEEKNKERSGSDDIIQAPQISSEEKKIESLAIQETADNKEIEDPQPFVFEGYTDDSHSNLSAADSVDLTKLQPQLQKLPIPEVPEEFEDSKRLRQPTSIDEDPENQEPRKQAKNQAHNQLKSIFRELNEYNRQRIQCLKSVSDNDQQKKKREKYWDDKKEFFLCQKDPETLQTEPLNNFICEQLTRLMKIYEVQKDRGRACAYRKAVNAVRALKVEIKDQRDIIHVKHIGPRITDKILELIETGKMNKLESFRKDQRYQAIDALCDVWGIGPATATELYNKGIKTIDELRKNQHLLTKSQKMGLKYVEEFRKKIPRAEIERIQTVVKATVYDLVGSDLLHIIETCGSYRRGRDFCGDIDIIITRRDGVFQRDLPFRLVDRLFHMGLITDHFNIPRMHHEHSSYTYMGVCQIDGGLHRRIDIKYYPLDQFAYAILYFTGSDMFNRSMRMFAKKKGYNLSDHALTPVERTSSDKKGWEGANIICYTEQDIFKFLKLEYREPRHRHSQNMK